MNNADLAVFLQNSWWIILLILAWTLPWKGYALWTAARRGEKWWFVALLVINTLALLEIFYIFAIVRRAEKSPAEES